MVVEIVHAAVDDDCIDVAVIGSKSPSVAAMVNAALYNPSTEAKVMLLWWMSRPSQSAP